jgi:hypothetical protein
MESLSLLKRLVKMDRGAAEGRFAITHELHCNVHERSLLACVIIKDEALKY